MSIVAHDIRPAEIQRSLIGMTGSAMIVFGVFLSGFVMSEPAPYELVMAVQIVLWFLLGLTISRTVAIPLALLLLYNVGGMFSLLMLRELGGGPMYIAVSTFLALTTILYAAVIEQRPQRLELIFKAWVAAAIITALLGILGYFHAFPGAEMFTRYDRAMGAFQDPNVFGPFLVAPILYLLHKLLTGRLIDAPLTIVGLLILVLAVFLAFSRAAWGLLLFSGLALVLVMLLKERTSAFRLKIMALSVAALLLLVLALVIALQFERVSDLFTARARLVQDYDGAHMGRFERHKIGFLLAMERPLGIGPMVLGQMYGEDEHNIWLKSLTTYGWLGFVSYVILIGWTIAAGFRYLLRDRPWQPHLMIGWIVLVGHGLIGNVIDTDHWRHFYLVLGIVWGCIALEQRHQRRLRNPPLPKPAAA